MSKKVQTIHPDYRECILDIDIFGRIVSTPQQSLEELTETLFEEFKRRKPLPTLEARRYELSRFVSQDYQIYYDGELDLQDNETLVDLPSMQGSGVVFEDLSSLIPAPAMQEKFRYENGVTDDIRSRLIKKFDLETGELFKPGIKQTENIVGSVEEDKSLMLTDEQVDNLGEGVGEEPEELAESSDEVSEGAVSWGSSGGAVATKAPMWSIDEDVPDYAKPSDTDEEESEDDEDASVYDAYGSDEDYVDTGQSRGVAGESSEDDDSGVEYGVAFDEDDDYDAIPIDESDEEEVPAEGDGPDGGVPAEDDDFVDVYGEEAGDDDDSGVDDAYFGDESDGEEGSEDDDSGVDDAYFGADDLGDAGVQDAAGVAAEGGSYADEASVEVYGGDDEEAVDEDDVSDADIYFGDDEDVPEDGQSVGDDDLEEGQSEDDDDADVYFGDEEEVPEDGRSEDDDDADAYFGMDESEGSYEEATTSGVDDFDVKPEFIESPPAPTPQYKEPQRKPQQVQPQQSTSAQSPIIDRSSEPTDIRAFVRKHPRCDIQFALNYFTKKQIDDAVRLGRIIKKGNILR